MVPLNYQMLIGNRRTVIKLEKLRKEMRRSIATGGRRFHRCQKRRVDGVGVMPGMNGRRTALNPKRQFLDRGTLTPFLEFFCRRF